MAATIPPVASRPVIGGGLGYSPRNLGGSHEVIRRSTTLQFLAALGLIALYSAVLVYQGPKGKEKYPVFKWELFSRVPARVKSDYGIRITSVDGQTLWFTPYFQNAGAHFNRTSSPDATHLARSIGSAITRGHEKRSSDLRARFEARFFAGHDVTYEVVERTYDTKERVTCRCYQAEDVVGTYEYDGR